MANDKREQAMEYEMNEFSRRIEMPLGEGQRQAFRAGWSNAFRYATATGSNKDMNDNETNAPIKLPVRYDFDTFILKDAEGRHIADVLVTDDEAKQIVAALNEADVLRAEVEGYRALFNQADVGSEFYLKDHLGNIEKCDDGKWRTQMATMQYGKDARWEYVQEGWDSPLAAYAAIKPNAVEEGTE